MKSAKDEGKPMDPLFPRLRINDADKGGPRAPPRNKMALCEQFNVPSQNQRLTSSGSMAMLPVPSSIVSSSFVPSASSNHGGCHKNVTPTFCSSPGYSDFTDKCHSFFSSGINLKTTLTCGPHTMGPINYPGASLHSPMTAEINLFQPHGFSMYKDYGAKKLGDGGEPVLPFFFQSGRSPNYRDHQYQLDKDKLNSVHSSSPRHSQSGCLKQLKEDATTELNLGDHVINQAEESGKLSQTSEFNAEKSIPIRPTGEKSLTDIVSSDLKRNRICQLGSRQILKNQNKKSCLSDELSRLHDHHSQTIQESRTLQESVAATNGTSENLGREMKKRSASTMEDLSGSVPQLGDTNNIESTEECSKVEDCCSSQVGNVDKSEEISNNCVMDSLSGQVATPDDVVRVIGQKLFWKARRTIVHQQRIFAMQIFELHRLIKVQRLMAETPQICVNFHLPNPMTKASPATKLLSETFLHEPQEVAKPDGNSPNSGSKDCEAEAACRKLPPLTNIAHNEHLVQQSAHKSSLTVASTPYDAKMAPWFFHPPPGNQWLIPVRSPSEGLIYKPYTGPYPPPGGFMAPIYGSCSPLSLNTMGGAAYCVPPPHQQDISRFPCPTTGQSFFQPYGVPMKTSGGSSLEVEQMHCGAQSTRQDKNSSTGDTLIRPYQSLCNASSQRSGVMSYNAEHFPASKESDLLGSTGSSPPERSPCNALSLFPTTPTLQGSHQSAKSHSSENQGQVIKVVPHNPKTACVSAARILNSIQEERRKHE